jgi:Arc/MetJ-type ribon-helix-helix transcriptional regulator
MSDRSDRVSQRRLSVRLTKALEKRLKEITRTTGRSESEVVREALATYQPKVDESARESCLDLAKRLGLVGDVKGLPSDLSTNPTYMEGFGRD